MILSRYAHALLDLIISICNLMANEMENPRKS